MHLDFSLEFGMLLFVVVPVKSPPQKRRGLWWAFWLAVALGLIVLGHGCHSGDHDVDDEPSIQQTQRERGE